MSSVDIILKMVSSQLDDGDTSVVVLENDEREKNSVSANLLPEQKDSLTNGEQLIPSEAVSKEDDRVNRNADETEAFDGLEGVSLNFQSTLTAEQGNLVETEEAGNDAEVASDVIISGLLALEGVLSSQLKGIAMARRRIEKAKRLIGVKGHGLRPLVNRNIEAINALEQYRTDYRRKYSSLVGHWKSVGLDQPSSYANISSPNSSTHPAEEDDDIVVLDEVSVSDVGSVHSNNGNVVDVVEVLSDVDCEASTTNETMNLTDILNAENRAFAEEEAAISKGPSSSKNSTPTGQRNIKRSESSTPSGECDIERPKSAEDIPMECDALTNSPPENHEVETAIDNGNHDEDQTEIDAMAMQCTDDGENVGCSNVANEMETQHQTSQ
uniref:IQ motif, EF-hand binding site n=1 Tax=Haemonchus contortus TaxID=6289 RepID=A0A7I4XZ45_HAECO